MELVREVKPLWEHQRQGVMRAVQGGRFGLLYEMGAGKTPTAITILRNWFHRAGRPMKTLILCPAIVIENWQKEIAAWSQCLPFVQILSGSTKDRILQLENATHRGRTIFVTNFEALDMEGLFWHQKGKSRKVREDLGLEVLIVDESHRLKNPAGKRTKVAIQIADKVQHCLILTGSPILRNAEDVWAQWRILDGGRTFGQNFLAFKHEYFVNLNANAPAHVTWPNWQPRGDSSEKIREKIAPTSMRVTKAECLSLPPLVEQRIAIKMSPDQRRHYDQMADEYVVWLKSTLEKSVQAGAVTSAKLAITKMLRLQQILAGYLPLDDGRIEPYKSNPRLDAVAELLEDLEGQSVIIWTAFSPTYPILRGLCDKLGRKAVMLTGEQTQKEKDQAVRLFKERQADVIIANPAAGGTGVNLQEAGTSIWYCRTFSLEHRLQGMARNHRGGSEKLHKSVTLVDLVASDTIDERILDSLGKKEDVSESILDWSRKIFLGGKQ